MADPMTQSSQISSSKRFNDEQNSVKDSKYSDSFLSSSPVSLIQSPQDERVKQDSGMPSEGVATSLRFMSQPSSYSPLPLGRQVPDVAPEGADRCHKNQEKTMVVRGNDLSFGGRPEPVVNPPAVPPRQDLSPIKTSPVSERIKALEALAAKQSDSDNWNDGGALHFKERHYEKSPTDTVESFSPFLSKEPFPDQDSPESPFEVLGDTRRGIEFEDTADWMQTHLPPAPNFGTEVPELDAGKVASDFCHLEESQAKAAAIAGVPDAFMDSPCKASEPDFLGQVQEPAKQTSIEEEESEFDLSFLPTAFIWDKQERTSSVTKVLPGLPALCESKPPASPPPPAGFGSPTPPPSPPASPPPVEAKPGPCGSDSEPAEVVEMDSSGESDDTVIEDAAPHADPVTTGALSAPEESVSVLPSVPVEDEPTQPTTTEKYPIQVPIINVIETEEQALSDEEEQQEEEDYQVVEEPTVEGPMDPVESSTDHKPHVEESQPPAGSPPAGSSDFSKESRQPLTDSSAEILSEHQSIKSETESLTSVVSADLTSEETAQVSSVSEEIEDSEILQLKPLVSENAQIQNESQEKSSINMAEPGDLVVKKSSNLLDCRADESKDAPVDFESDVDLNNDAAQLASLSPSFSFQEKADLNLSQEDLTQLSSLPAFSSKVDLLQENLSIGECVPRSTELHEGSSPPNSLEMEQCLDTVAKTSPIHSGSQSEAEFVPSTGVPTTTESNSAKAVTGSEDAGVVAAEDVLLKPVGGQPSPRDLPPDLFSSFQDNSPDIKQEPVGIQPKEMCYDDSSVSSELDALPPLEPGSVSTGVVENRPEAGVGEHSPGTTSDPESIEPECSVSAATDSFVEFMRECLKSRQDEEPETLDNRLAAGMELPKMGAPTSVSPPAMILDLEQEHLTIRALKELGSSQEEAEETLPGEEAPKTWAEQEGKATSRSSIPQTTVPRTTPSPSHPSESQLEETTAKEVEGIDAWAADAFYLAEHALAAILTHLSVRELVYWRDPKKSGVVFGLSLLLLLSLAAFSVISVASYLLLALLCVTISFRIYKSVIQAVQKSDHGHPFKAFMEKDVSVPPETFHKHVDTCLSYINCALKKMSHLFLVEDLVDSLKLAFFMWLMTYVGAVFNGITILILANILLFSLPLVYEKNKTQIDKCVEIIRTHFNQIVSKVQDKLPGSVKRNKVE